MRSRLLIILMWLPLAVLGQEAPEGFAGDTLAPSVSATSFEMMPVMNTWLLSSNPAGHRFNVREPGRMSVNYTGETGDFKRAMEGDTLKVYSFKTEKYKRIERTFFYGAFSYDKSFERNVKYTNVNDPYRGTPYLLIDTTGRNDLIDREFFKLKGDISTPLFWRVNWGMSTDMKVGLAAQDRDPRPKNKVMDLGIASGFLVDLSPVRIGFNGLYSYYNEDIEVDIIEKNTQLLFLQMQGFTSFLRHEAASFNRLYQGKSYGGEAQLNVDIGPVNTLFGSKFLYMLETADDGRKAGDASWSYMKGDSELEGNELYLYNRTTLRTGKILQAANASFRESYRIGSEIIQRLEQVGEAGAVDWVDYGKEEKYVSNSYELDMDYAFYTMYDACRKGFEFRLGASYLGGDQSYFLPDMHLDHKSQILRMAIGQSLYVGAHEFTILLSSEAKKNLESSRQFPSEGFISENILYHDYRYLTGDYRMRSVDLAYAVDMNRLFEKYFLRVKVSEYHAQFFNPRNSGGKRVIFSISTGVIF